VIFITNFFAFVDLLFKEKFKMWQSNQPPQQQVHSYYSGIEIESFIFLLFDT
jgi:hypothetical protein